MKFAVHGLPRSQTFWASQVLTTCDSVCLHEPVAKGALIGMGWQEVLETIELLPEENVGLAESINESDFSGGYREVVIRRDVDQVAESLDKLGFTDFESVLYGMDHLLQEKMSAPGVLVLPFPVEKESEVVKLFQHCLGRKPTRSELRKANAKIFVPRWHVERAVSLSRKHECR